MFSSSLSPNFVLECKATMLINEKDISRLVVYMQQFKDEKNKYEKIGERTIKSKGIQSMMEASKLVGKMVHSGASR